MRTLLVLLLLMVGCTPKAHYWVLKPQSTKTSENPIVVSESMQRALWKTKHCGLGVSFEACEAMWRKAKESQPNTLSEIWR